MMARKESVVRGILIFLMVDLLTQIFLLMIQRHPYLCLLLLQHRPHLRVQFNFRAKFLLQDQFNLHHLLQGTGDVSNVHWIFLTQKLFAASVRVGGVWPVPPTMATPM